MLFLAAHVHVTEDFPYARLWSSPTLICWSTLYAVQLKGGVQAIGSRPFKTGGRDRCTLVHVRLEEIWNEMAILHMPPASRALRLGPMVVLSAYVLGMDYWARVVSVVYSKR